MHFSVLSVSPEALSLIRELIIQISVEDRKLVLWGRRIASDLRSALVILGVGWLDWFSIPALRFSNSMVFCVFSGWVLNISLPSLVDFRFLGL